MTMLRVGTRGSELALIQTRLVCDLIQRHHVDLSFEEIIISTHGDQHKDQPFDKHWPINGFVGAIEEALLAGEIDVAVHSYKDLPSQWTPGLVIAAVPKREQPHDVMVSAIPLTLADLPAGITVGTGSPRRAAQLRRVSDVQIVPIRGNVPTRLEKVARGELDAVVVAAAGLIRLGFLLPQDTPPEPRTLARADSPQSCKSQLRLSQDFSKPLYTIPLPVETFVPAAGQGALAVQVRRDSDAVALTMSINHADTERAINAERALMLAVNAGCHTPVGALATIEDGQISLCAQLFDDAGDRMVEGDEVGSAAQLVGQCLGQRLVGELQA